MQTLHCEPQTLRWQDMPMPDANGPVRLARLNSLTPAHFWALVVFPPGWQRLRAGHYSVDEDFLLLQGELTINGVQWCAQEHGFVPANTLRDQTQSLRGCVACARFYGRPQWHTGSAEMAPVASVRHSLAWSAIEPVDLHGHGRAHLVFEFDGASNGVLPQATLAALRARGVELDAFNLTTRLEAASLVGDVNTETNFYWAHWPSPH